MSFEEDDFFQLSYPINELWKNNNLLEKSNKPYKQKEQSLSTISDALCNEVADLIDVVYSVHKKYEGKVSDENILNREQSEMLAGLVPDLLIDANFKTTGYSTTFAGIILFIDISGFTAMCEKYSKSGTNGTDRMTMTLNRYLGPMVYEIYFHGGDVVKFAGDALLAVWKASVFEYAWNLVHSAIVCSKYIQHTFGSYQTDVGIILKVKAAIASGNLTFSIIGPPNYKHFIVCGPPVEEIKQTERLCSAGDVLVAPSAWRECSKRNYYYEEKFGCALILRIIYNPSDIKLKFFEFPKRNLSGTSLNVSNLSGSGGSTVTTATELEQKRTRDTSVRPSLQALYRNDDVKYIQGFIIGQVVQQIEAEQPLDFLTEMRTITTMFVNLIPVQKDVVDKLIMDVNESYCIISKFVTQSLGSVNLVGMFDKDVMFLVTFGLRGEDHEGETARSLNCAYDIRMALKDKEYVKSISVGVTCGMTYCGIVGHVVRKCYTVLGSTVNKAARLMCYYENKVTCDEQTYRNSNLPQSCFSVQETKQLKGIKDAGVVFEYLRSGGEELLIRETNSGPPLGHDQNIKIYMENLNFKHLNCIIVSGAQGVGKTFLLEEFYKHTKELKPVLITLPSYSVTQSYYLIQNIFKEILGYNEWRKKEETLTLLMNSNTKYPLHVLNEVLQANFEDDNEVVDSIKIMDTFKALASKVCGNHVIIIDDACYMDEKSIPFLKEIINLDQCIVVMSVIKSDRQESEQFEQFVRSVGSKTILLNNLEDKLIIPVCCQLIGVSALPKSIVNVLLNRSGGNPGWCFNFLRYMIEAGKLTIITKSVEEVKNDKEFVLQKIKDSIFSRGRRASYAVSSPRSSEASTSSGASQTSDAGQFLRKSEDSTPRSSQVSSAGPSLKKSRKSEENTEIKVAIRTENYVLPASICGMIMSTFDRLEPYQQVLLKCATAMGMEFSFSQLASSLPYMSLRQIERAIKQLFQMNILECRTAFLWNIKEGIKDKGYSRNERKNLCYCHDPKKSSLISDEVFEDISHFSSTRFCQNLKFTVSLIQQRIYNLMTISQCKIFHAKAFKYLINLKVECSVCKAFVNKSDKRLRNNMYTKFELKEEVNFLEEDINVNKARSKSMRKITITEEGFNTFKLTLNQLANDKTDDVISKLKSLQPFQMCLCWKKKKKYYETLCLHGESADKHQKEIFCLLSYAEVLMELEEKDVAVSTLNKALKKVDTYQSSFLNRNIILGRIYTLAGQGSFLRNDMKEAERYLQKALDKFKKTTIQSWIPVPWLASIGKNKYSSEILELKLIAYNILCNVYIVVGNIEKVQQWALHAYRITKKFECQFVNLCLVYTHLITCRGFDAANVINHFMEHDCIENLHNLRPKEALHIGMVFTAIFKRKMIEGKELCYTLKAGAISLEIAKRFKASEVRCQILPLMVYTLLFGGYLKDAVTALKEYSNEELHQPTKYYILCMDILLYGGVGLISVFKCIQHARDLEKIHDAMTTLDAQLFVKILLWHLRNNQFKEAQYWFDKLGPFPEAPSSLNFEHDVIYLQCFILETVYECNQSDIISFADSLAKLKKCLNFMTIIEHSVTLVDGFLQPYILFMKSYVFKLLGEHKKSEEYLTKAKKRCDQFGNALVSAWIDHNKTVWIEPSHYSANIWVIHSKPEHMNVKEFNIEAWPDFMYSLPVITNKNLTFTRSFFNLLS